MESTDADQSIAGKAAAFVASLNKEVLAKVLKHLSEPELTRLLRVQEAHGAGTSAEAGLIEVAKEFLQASKKTAPGHFRDALVLALGEDGAAQIMKRDRWRALASRVKAAALAAVLQNERPEVVAIVLAKLPSTYAAELVAELPESVRADSIARLACGTSVSDQAAEALAGAIEQIVSGADADLDRSEGSKSAAAMLNQLEIDAATAILEQIRSADPARAQQIEREMFHFENLLSLDTRVLERILTELQPERLAIALKGIPLEQREILMSALTDQVKMIVTQELEDAGKVPAGEVRAARRAITNLALQMERDGKIRLHQEQQDLIS